MGRNEKQEPENVSQIWGLVSPPNGKAVNKVGFAAQCWEMMGLEKPDVVGKGVPHITFHKGRWAGRRGLIQLSGVPRTPSSPTGRTLGFAICHSSENPE